MKVKRKCLCRPEILQVGVTVFRYTSHEHVRPWLIYSLKNVKGRGITDLNEVSELGEGNDVLELPPGMQLPVYLPIRERPEAAVATTEVTQVSSPSETGNGQTVATQDLVSAVCSHDLGSAMKRQLSETPPGVAPPHKRLHLDNVTTFEQNANVQEVEVQRVESTEAVETRADEPVSTVMSDQSQLHLSTSAQQLITHQPSDRCQVTPVVRSPATVKQLATPVTRSQAGVKELGTPVTRSPAAVKQLATSVTRPPAAVKQLATPVTRSPAAVKQLVTPVTTSPAAVKQPAKSVTLPAAVKQPAISVTTSPVAVEQRATSVTTSPAAVKQPAKSVTSPAAVKQPAKSVTLPAAVKQPTKSVTTLPAAVKQPATAVTRSPVAIEQPAKSVTTPPAAVKQPAKSVTRSPVAIKQPVTPVTGSPTAANVQVTPVSSQQMTLDPTILDAITKSGVQGPFRLQLAGNLKLPTSGPGQKIKFSVMSKTQAAKLGLTEVTMPASQSQVATSQLMTRQTPAREAAPAVAAGASTVRDLPAVQATRPAKSQSQRPSEATSVQTVKTKSVADRSGKKDGSVPQLDGSTDDWLDGSSADKESQQMSFCVDDELGMSCDQTVDSVDNVDNVLLVDSSSSGGTTIPQLDGTVDGKIPDTSNSGDKVNTQSGDVTAQSGDVTAQSGDVTAQSGDVTTQSGDVTAQSGDVTTQSGDVTSQSGDVTTRSDDVTAQSGDVTSQSGDVTSQSGDVTTRSDDVTFREQNCEEDEKTLNGRAKKQPVKHHVDSPENKGNYRKVRLVARPWKTPEGTVNHPTLKMMLEAVMMFIMTKPGVTKADLVAKYNPLLQPVPLTELTQMLQELGCVKQCIVGRSHKTSVFAPRAKLSLVGADTGQEVVTYIPTVDCIIKLGQFETQLSK